MAVIASDIKFYLSGGSGNTAPASSIGGAISTTEISATALNNLWDDVSDTEADDGDIEYRCFYVKNTNGSDTLTGAGIYISSNTPSADTAMAIGLDAAGKNGTAQTIANENTAPGSVTFSAAGSSGAALSFGNLAAGEYYPVWMRRTIEDGAGGTSSDPCTVRVTGTP